MVQSGRLHRYTYTDYVALEESNSALAAEVLRALGNAVAERPCRVHTSDLRIYVEATGMATFPDGLPKQRDRPNTVRG